MKMSKREGYARTAILEKLISECLLGDKSWQTMMWEQLKKAR